MRRDVRSSLDPAFFLLVLPDEMLVTHVSGWFFSMFDGRSLFLVPLVWFMVCSSVVVSGAQ